MRFYVRAHSSAKFVRVTDLIKTGVQTEFVQLPTNSAACGKTGANCWRVRVAGYEPQDTDGQVKIEWRSKEDDEFKVHYPEKDVHEGQTIVVGDIEYRASREYDADASSDERDAA
jgi:hypothetical protein